MKKFTNCSSCYAHISTSLPTCPVCNTKQMTINTSNENFIAPTNWKNINWKNVNWEQVDLSQYQTKTNSKKPTTKTKKPSIETKFSTFIENMNPDSFNLTLTLIFDFLLIIIYVPIAFLVIKSESFYLIGLGFFSFRLFRFVINFSENKFKKKRLEKSKIFSDSTCSYCHSEKRIEQDDYTAKILFGLFAVITTLAGGGSTGMAAFSGVKRASKTKSGKTYICGECGKNWYSNLEKELNPISANLSSIKATAPRRLIIII